MRLLAILLLAAAASADVRLPGLFSDNMVLQKGEPLVIWGWADPGETVTVTFAKETAKVNADAKGHWRVAIGPFQYLEDRVLKVNSIALRNVCVGEVWVCSGQSNMQWTVGASNDAQKEIAAADHPKLRLFSVPRRVSGQPLDDVKGAWQVCTPKTIPGFSAVAYYFGRTLVQERNVTVGLIHSSWGGTPAEAWTRRAALESHRELEPIVKRWDEALAKWPENRKAFQQQLAEWQKKAAAAKLAGLAPPRRPWPGLGPNHPHRASGLFNSMIAPLTPFTIRGVIWYQGESNAGRAEQYATLFPAMIRDWRDAWGRGDFPFYFVQLANFRAAHNEPVESAWAELREAQRLALQLPHTGMAVTLDIGDWRNIHPRNKQEVGRRLALWALDKKPPSGPLFKGVRGAGGRMSVFFDHAEGLQTAGGDPLRGFQIAGADKQWRWAHARIDGARVLVSHPAVPRPVAVRYGWADNPGCNLLNGADLPASPFRTDAWDWTTKGKR